MRNLKKYLAMALAMVMMLTAFPVLGAESFMNEDKAQDLNAFGLYAGTNPEEFEPALDRNVNREEAAAMVVRIFGVTLTNEEEVLPTVEEAMEIVEGKFVDADQISSWAVRHVAYGVENGYINGYPDGTFKPQGALVGRAFATMILANLDYDVVYEEAGQQFGEAAALYDDAVIEMYNSNASINRDVLVGMTYDSLDAYSANEDTNVAAMLVEKGAVDQAIFNDKQIPVTKNGEVYVKTEDGEEGENGEETVTPAGAASEMTEVKMTGEDTMVAMFDGALTEAAVFTVTGPTAVEVTATWNEAMTEATIKSSVALLDGVYTVKVVDGEFNTESTVNVAKNGVTSIEIIGDQVIRIDGAKGIAYVKLSDSYGNDVTESKIYDVTINASDATVIVTDSKKGEIEITTTANSGAWQDYPPTPQLVTLSAYSKTAVNGMVASASKTLQVTELAKVEKVELGEVVLPAGYETLQIKKSNAAYIVMKAYDQYGREVDDTTKLDPANESVTAGEVFYSVGNTTLKNQLTLVKETNSDGEDEVRLKIDTTNLTTNDARPVNLSVVSKYRGVTSNTVVLDIKQGSEPYKVSFGAPSGVLAKYDDRGSDALLVVDLIVHDEEGNQLTADQIADKAGDGTSNSGSFTFSGFDTAANLTFKIATSGEHKGKMVVTPQNTGSATAGPNSSGSQTMTIYIKNGVTPSSSLTIDVKDKAEPRTIQIDDQPTSNLLFNSNAKFNYKILDQYGREMSDQMLANTNLMTNATTNGGAYTTEFAVKLSTSDIAKATASFVGHADLVKNDAAPFAYIRKGIGTKKVADLNNTDLMSITAKEETGTVTIKAELVVITHANVATAFTAAHTSILSTASKSFYIADGIPSSMNFEVEAIPTLKGLDVATATLDHYAAIAGGATVGIDAGEIVTAQMDRYAHKLVVKAKDESGNEYTVPYNRITGVSSSNTAYVGIDTDGTDYYVYGLDADLITNNLTEKTETLTVSIATDSGPKTATASVTVSKDAAKIQEIHFIDVDPTLDAKWNSRDFYTAMPETYNSVSEFTVAEVVAGSADLWIITKDQYGVYKVRNDNTLAADDTMTLNNTQDASFSTITIDNDGGAAANEISAAVAGVYDFNVANSFKANKSLVFTMTIDGISGQVTVRTGATGVAEGTTLDKTAPTIASIGTIDNDGNGKIDFLKITFSESVDDSTYADTSATVTNSGDGAGKIGTALATGAIADPGAPNADVADDAVIYLALTENATNTNTEVVGNFDTVAAGMILDLSGNILADDATTALTDTAAPVLVSLWADAGATGTTVTFTENVVTVAGGVTAVAASGADVGAATTVAFAEDLVAGTTLTGVANGNFGAGDGTDVVTLTFDAADALQVEDAAGNSLNISATAAVTDTDTTD